MSTGQRLGARAADARGVAKPRACGYLFDHCLSVGRAGAGTGPPDPELEGARPDPVSSPCLPALYIYREREGGREKEREREREGERDRGERPWCTPPLASGMWYLTDGVKIFDQWSVLFILQNAV
jgi:hypothetical protein